MNMKQLLSQLQLTSAWIAFTSTLITVHADPEDLTFRALQSFGSDKSTLSNDDFWKDFQTRTLEQSFEASPGTKLEMRIEDADVVISSHTEPRIQIRFEHAVKANNAHHAKPFFDSYDVAFESTARGLQLHAKFTHRLREFRSSPSQARFEILVPADYPLAIHLVDGDLAMEHLSGANSIHLVDGKLNARDINGTLQANIVDGDFTLEQMMGTLNVRLTDGDLTATSISAPVQAQVTDGDIHMSWAGSVVEAIQLATTDGDVALEFPSDAAFNLNLVVTDGKAVVGFPVEQRQQKSDSTIVISRINGGGAPVSITTTDGDVRLKARKTN